MNIGIVYRIFYGDLSYIGSTINLKERMWNHRSKYNNCSSKEYQKSDKRKEYMKEYLKNKSK